MSFHNYAKEHYFKGVDSKSLERLENWAHSRLELGRQEWLESDYKHMLDIKDVKNSKSEIQMG